MSRRRTVYWRLAMLLAAAVTAYALWSDSMLAQAPQPANNPADPSYNSGVYPAQVREPTESERRQLLELFLAAGGTGTPVADELAVRKWRELIELSSRTLGPDHPTTANYYFRLADHLASRGQSPEATALYQRALAIQLKTLGRYDKTTIWTLSAVAASLPSTEAEPFWLEMLAASEARLKAARMATADCLERLADNIARQSRIAETMDLRARVDALRAAKVDDSIIAGPPVAGMEEAADEGLLTIAFNPAFVRPATPSEEAERMALTSQAEVKRIAGDLPGAAMAWHAALKLDERTWGPEHPGVGASLVGLAHTVAAQGMLVEANVYLERARKVFRNALGKGHFETLRASELLAENLELQKKFADAEAVRREILAVRQAVMRSRLRNYADNLERYADSLQRVMRLSEAEASLRRALAIYEALKGKGAGMTSHLLVKLGSNLDSQGRATEAEPLYAQAAVGYANRIMADPADDAWLASTIALNAFKQGKIAGVEQALKQSLAVYRSSQIANRLRTAEGLANLAYFYLEIKQPELARPLLEEALAIRSQRLGDLNGATVWTMQNLAFANLATERPEAALDVARKALAGRAALKGVAGASEPEPAQRSLRTHYGAAATTLMHASWAVAERHTDQAAALRVEAFEAAQGAASSAAAEAMTQRAARRLAEAIGAGEIEARWRTSLDRIDWLSTGIAEAALEGSAGDAKRTRLLEDLNGQMQIRKEAETELATKFGPYFDMLKPASVAVADLQATSGANAKLLRDDEALILLNPGAEWLPEGRRNGLIFVVTKQRVAWAEIDLSPQALADEIRTLHNQLASGGQTIKPGDDAFVVGYERERAFRLYTKLFGATQIQQALAGKVRWVLVPQGVFVSLPFAALVTEKPEGGEEFDAHPDYLRHKTKWLGLEKTIALAPSVSVLRLQRLNAPAATMGDRFFGLGDPAFRGVPDPPPPPDDLVSRSMQRRAPNEGRSYFRNAIGDPERIAELNRLPATEREILSLAAFFKATDGDVALQMNATEAEVRRRNSDKSLSRADVIAFATHGLIAGDLGETITEPALALTPPKLPQGQQPIAENDGLLTASEAAALSLSARWVILSACNTAAGGSQDSESLTGLARAFLMAGAHSLLVSHYPVLDSSAEKLTTRAVREARDNNLRGPEALKIAMQALLNDESRDARGASYAHPSAWAPFTIIDAH